MKRVFLCATILATGVGVSGCGESSDGVEPLAASRTATHALTGNEQLGSSIFFDEQLSINKNQSCASCHGPEAGWTGPISAINAAGAVYEGSVAGRFGNRKPPSAAYATFSPVFYRDKDLFVGGNFWDGRATGEKLGNPAADQAQGPFLNPVEQGLPDNACVVYRVCNPAVPADYPVSFTDVWGGDACDITWPPDVEVACATEGATVTLSPGDLAEVETAYDRIALSIAAYEASSEVNAFSSKYDASLAKTVALTRSERKGLSIFQGKGKCARCHVLTRGNGPTVFTDFTFDNLGVPRNPDNPWYSMPASFNPDGFDWVDLGLGGFLATAGYPEEDVEDAAGYQKVPTLRNLDTRPDAGFAKAYGHNGYFKSLWQIVHFYNTRDVKPTCPDDPMTAVNEARFTRAADAIAQDCWPEPEVAETVNGSELGNLHLSLEEEQDLVSFLRTLSDGFVP